MTKVYFWNYANTEKLETQKCIISLPNKCYDTNGALRWKGYIFFTLLIHYWSSVYVQLWLEISLVINYYFITIELVAAQEQLKCDLGMWCDEERKWWSWLYMLLVILNTFNVEINSVFIYIFTLFFHLFNTWEV